MQLAINSVPKEAIEGGDPKGEALRSLHTGVSMTQAELLKTFKRHGVEMFDPMGEQFDPDKHEAVFQAPCVGKEPGTVFDVQKTGYTLNGRLLRAAQVGVVKE